MVQYIITPWRNRQELLGVRRAFYPTPEVSKSTNDEERHKAVELVSVWVQRGNCPHSVESTALLMSAMLNEATGTSAYAMRAAYSAAFSRFVTGLLDGYQDKKHKLSMYSIAKNIGLQATLVEIRHQCTHEELPSLANLRAATERSLLWIWDHYWKNLEESVTPGDIDERRTVLRDYLQWRANCQSKDQDQDQDQEHDFREGLWKWNKEQLLEGLMDLNDTSTIEPSILLEALRLTRTILSGEENLIVRELLPDVEPAVPGKEIRSLENIRLDIAKAESTLQKEDEKEDLPRSERDEETEGTEEDEDDGDGTGWEMWKGPWVPKPIGVV